MLDLLWRGLVGNPWCCWMHVKHGEWADRVVWRPSRRGPQFGRKVLRSIK